MRSSRIGLLLLCAAAAALFSLNLLSASVQAEDAADYNRMGFAFSNPARWTLSCPKSSDWVTGNLSLQGSCGTISLSWSRDPGVSLQEILKMIEKAYDSGEVSVLSSKQGRIEMHGQATETLSLVYELKGHRAEKQFVVWNSSRSDRIFLASLSGYCVGDKGNDSLWDRFVGSFQDNGGIDPMSLSPASAEGAWSRVLGDLLSCYHYTDTAKLPSRKARVAITHQLSLVNGTYILDSEEAIRVDPPTMAAARSGAVERILAQAGYKSRLIQRSGTIAVAVLDLSGGWQQISVNPTSPQRCIGVLLNEKRDGGIYQTYPNLAELAGENGINDSFDLDVQVIKDCDPSSLVELVPGLDESWDDTLQDLLDHYDYDKYYQEDAFDCSDTAQICWRVLRELGYDARLMMSYPGHPLEPHMWVVVRSPQEDGFVAVETANTDENRWLVHLGRVVTDEKYYYGIMYNSSAQFSRLHPEEAIS